jgi:hypothetical protein
MSRIRSTAALQITVLYTVIKIPEHLGDIFVVDPEEVCGTLLLELVISGDLDGGARLQLHLLTSVILHNRNQCYQLFQRFVTTFYDTVGF